MSKQIITMKYGQETEYPQSLIDDAPTQGPFDDYAEYILSEFDVQVSLADSIRYLKDFGAWDDTELQDLEANKARLLWVSILDCKENGTKYFYMGA